MTRRPRRPARNVQSTHPGPVIILPDMNITDTLDRLRATHERSLRVISSLRDSLARTTEPRLKDLLSATISRVHLCNNPYNITVEMKPVFTETGYEYHPVERAWRCNSILCPACNEYSSYLRRKALKTRISALKFKPFERVYFLTFTIPKLGLSLAETREIVNYAWSLMRKRQAWSSLIRGAAKSEEFTVDSKGPHYHLHVLAVSKFIRYDEYRRLWTDCVRESFAKFNQPYNVPTVDGLLVCKFKLVTDLKRSLFELAKYITKTDLIHRWPADLLNELVSTERMPRSFECTGCLSEAKTASVARKPIVHNTAITDGTLNMSNRIRWHEKVREFGAEAYITYLTAKVTVIWQKREFYNYHYRAKEQVVPLSFYINATA